MLRSNNTKVAAMRQREAKTCCVMIAAMLTISSAYAQGQAVTINYGTVESVSTVKKIQSMPAARWRAGCLAR